MPGGEKPAIVPPSIPLPIPKIVMRLHLLIAAASVAASLLLPSPVRAQESAGVEVRPGSALVDGARITARADTFQVSVDGVDPLRMVVRTAALGDTVLLRVERISIGDTELGADSFAVRTATLAPLHAHGRGIMGNGRLTYSPGRVTAVYTPEGGEERTISERLGAPVFYVNSVDMVLGSLPLRAGRSFELATWTPEGLDGVISAHVVGLETVPTVRGGRCSAWRVETKGENGDTSVYWMAESTRSLLAFSAGGMEIRILHHSACP